MVSIYGVLDSNNCHEDLSTNLTVAKRMASIRGYNYLSKRHVVSLAVERVAIKVGDKWVDYEKIKSDTMCFLQSLDRAILIKHYDELGAETCSPVAEDVYDKLEELQRLGDFYEDEVTF